MFNLDEVLNNEIEIDPKEQLTLINEVDENSFTKRIKERPTSAFENLANQSYESIDDELLINKEYDGKIKRIFYSEEKYTVLTVVYEVYDGEFEKTTSDSYTFGGDYDEWYMKQLVSFIKKLNGVYKDDIDWYSVSTIVNSLQFLVGTKVTLTQYITAKETRKNRVTVHGSFNRLTNKMDCN